MRVLPQSFCESKDVRRLLVDGLSCVIHKKVKENVLHKEGYVSTHALTLVLKGTLSIENYDQRIFVVHENQMIFIPKGLYMISDILPDNEPFEALVFFFDEALINEFIGSLQRNCSNIPLVSGPVFSCSKAINYYIESLFNLYSAGGTLHNKITWNKLFEFLHLLSVSEQGEDFVRIILSRKYKEKKSLKDFMNNNFYKPLTVEDYAYLTGRSLSTFNRDFKRQYNVSPKKWLMEKRMERAYDLLSTNNKSVSDIAAEVGYENFSHFIKAFHKKFGISPKQFHIKKRNEVMV